MKSSVSIQNDVTTYTLIDNDGPSNIVVSLVDKNIIKKSNMLLIKYPDNFFYDRGLFSVFSAVIKNMINAKVNNKKIYVDLSNSILYHYVAKSDQPKYTGDVWTQYYKNPPLEIPYEVITDFGHVGIFNKAHLTIDDIKYLREIYSTYFILKDDLKIEIQTKFDNISKDKKVLGVHIRGLDMNKRTILRPPEMWERYIAKEMDNERFTRILLCTDDLGYYEYFYKLKDKYDIVFGDGVKTRELNNFQIGGVDPYLSGKNAIMDCHMLGLCETLIRTQTSNLSAFAGITSSNVKKIIDVW